jgi:DNA-binding HxlR family transcriptional regulator
MNQKSSLREVPQFVSRALTANIQQLRELERDGIVTRTVHPQVPPKVEYALTKWGKAMCPALDELLEWAALRPKAPAEETPTRGGTRK